MMPRKLQAIDRFLRMVEPEPNTGCWLWKGSSSAGYGQFTVGSKADKSWRIVQASRFSYEHYVGAIPEGSLVLHCCDVTFCVNPGHLFLGSDLANARDKAEKGRGRKGSSGLPYGVIFHERLKRRPFEAQGYLNSKRFYLGTYPTVEEAGKVAMDFKLGQIEKWRAK